MRYDIYFSRSEVWCGTWNKPNSLLRTVTIEVFFLICLRVLALKSLPPVQAAIYQAEAFKQTTSELKNHMKNIKLNELEDIMDDMGDLLEDSNEISDVNPLFIGNSTISCALNPRFVV